LTDVAEARARPRIAWHGEFVGEGSLARVNRNLVRALLPGGTIDVVPCGEPLPGVEEMLGLNPRRREDLPPAAGPEVTIRHRWPPHFMRPQDGRYVHMQAWEFGAIPAAWIAGLRERADAVWCYSSYVRDMYVAGGLDPARVAVLSLGFDPAVYHPQVEPLPVTSPATCIFLFAGGFAVRKNVTGVIEAFGRAFRVGEDVALLIKDNPALGAYDPRGAAGLRELAERTDIPPVRFIEAQYSDADMARLYRTAAALVHPYRGEGFGLPVIEAMACATPVIVSRGGSTDDFVDDAVGITIPARRVALGTSIDGWDLSAPGWWLDPDVDALAAALRRVYEHRDEARALGARAARHAHDAWTWTHSVASLRERLTALLALPPQPRRCPEALESYGEDALYELFSRLRCVEPRFCAHTDDTPAARAAQRWGWTRVPIAEAMRAPVDLFDRTGNPALQPPPHARVVTDGNTIAVSARLLAAAGFAGPG